MGGPSPAASKSRRSSARVVAQEAQVLVVAASDRCGIRWAVENAIAYSPLPFEAKLPARPNPNAARAASRRSWRSESGASVPSTIMIEPPCAGGSGVLRGTAPAPPAGAGRAGRRSSTPRGSRARARPSTREAQPTPDLKPKQVVPVPAPERPLARLFRARGGDRLERVLGPHRQRAGVAEPAVEALAHHHVDCVAVARRLAGSAPAHAAARPPTPRPPPACSSSAASGSRACRAPPAGSTRPPCRSR